MESSLLTVILLGILIWMIFKCGKGVTKFRGSCCGKETTTNDETSITYEEIERKLVELEKVNKELKQELVERRGRRNG
ncbi:hypothetical protein [Evansella cellulosilytica]|uniref:Uncharacterized protein n=1 Tax=Evansella cellulosilytica (strain ATCC 21833 / DSM 2522 / FERM P-1141 / JCM 9156 / N-4) TaxID=649639 RepID=E6TQV5_EVAC2|nr:hypothetical protein [Evansella cellulosilytica]ADU31730.1 hypothetical protein Bcell_3488 [Evansella cellulosilytica DSM 2522]